VNVEVDKGRERSKNKDGGSSRGKNIKTDGTNREDRPGENDRKEASRGEQTKEAVSGCKHGGKQRSKQRASKRCRILVYRSRIKQAERYVKPFARILAKRST
jgi:hypothetical protein